VRDLTPLQNPKTFTPSRIGNPDGTFGIQADAMGGGILSQKIYK